MPGPFRFGVHVIVATALLLPFAAQEAQAHDLAPAFRWWHGQSVVVEGMTEFPWNSWYTAQELDATDVTASWCGQTPFSCGNTQYFQGTYNEPLWVDLSRAWAYYADEWHACVNWPNGGVNGQCSTAGEYRARWCEVFYDMSDNHYDGRADNRARHELLHCLGLAHNGNVSVLNPFRNDSSLTAHDTSDVNQRY